MANLSSLTRKEQVLATLQRADDWVDGTVLATAEVGGSEGLKRLRELRADGYTIAKRKHPDPERNIFQYRLVALPGWRQPAPDVAPPATPTLPWVQWHPGRRGSYTAKHRGFDLWASPAVSGWVWRASGPEATEAGQAATLLHAKEAAVEFVEDHLA